MKTKFSKFFQFCFQFFQFFGHPPHTKRFLCTFGQHIHLTPQKGLFYKVSWKWLKISTFVWTSYCALGWVKFDTSKLFVNFPKIFHVMWYWVSTISLYYASMSKLTYNYRLLIEAFPLNFWHLPTLFYFPSQSIEVGTFWLFFYLIGGYFILFFVTCKNFLSSFVSS